MTNAEREKLGRVIDALRIAAERVVEHYDRGALSSDRSGAAHAIEALRAELAGSPHRAGPVTPHEQEREARRAVEYAIECEGDILPRHHISDAERAAVDKLIAAVEARVRWEQQADNFVNVTNGLDFTADETMQVEISPEVGWQDRYKLYVHRGGRTIVRVCKLTEQQIDVRGFRRSG